MPPPVAVYVVAAVVGVAAVLAFKEFVYEPHIAPQFEAWAENFLERRRAARNRRASAVSVRPSRHRRASSSSSVSSHHTIDAQGDRGVAGRAPDPSVDEFELEALAAREVDEWRNEVLRSQDRPRDGIRKRRTSHFRNNFDEFNSTSTTLDESFTSLTHTPLASTHVISNVSSPMTQSTVSLPSTPTRCLRSASQTTTQGDVSSSIIVPHSPVSPIREMPWETSMLDASATHLSTDNAAQIDVTSPPLLTIPLPIRRSSANEGVPHPLPFTPTYQIMADDSPFGPILPDMPRSSAEMYGERPFSPITRVMGSSSSSAAGSNGTLSRADSMNSIRTLGGSTVPRRRSGLANEVLRSGSDDEDYHPLAPASTSTFQPADLGHGINGSVISSLSERYPVPPASPVIISPPASSFGVISAPSSPRSGSSEVVVQRDRSSSPLPHQTRSSLPVLQLPPDSPNQHSLLITQSRSATTSPALSFASFLSPMPISRGASESEGDEFLSAGDGDDDSDSDSSDTNEGVSEDSASDWSSTSRVAPGQGRGHMGPMHDRLHNPFLDFERGDGESEGSEVLVPEGGSEVGSEESWGSARRHLG